MMKLPVAKMPAVISESVATTLRAHGLSLTPEIVRELGRNTAQALFSLDLLSFASDEPSAADRLAVGQTLRALAESGRPNPETAGALARVGDWLREGALLEAGLDVRTRPANGGEAA